MPGGGEGRRAGRIGRGPEPASRARAPRPRTRHQDRSGRGKQVRKPDHRSHQRPPRKRAAWPGARGVRRGKALTRTVETPTPRPVEPAPIPPVPPKAIPDPVAVALPGEERVLRAAEKALNGQTRGLRAL